MEKKPVWKIHISFLNSRKLHALSCTRSPRTNQLASKAGKCECLVCFFHILDNNRVSASG